MLANRNSPLPSLEMSALLNKPCSVIMQLCQNLRYERAKENHLHSRCNIRIGRKGSHEPRPNWFQPGAYFYNPGPFGTWHSSACFSQSAITHCHPFGLLLTHLPSSFRSRELRISCTAHILRMSLPVISLAGGSWPRSAPLQNAGNLERALAFA